MTPEQAAKLFGQIFAMLDADRHERAIALEKLHARRAELNWPSFGDILRQLEATISPQALEAAERTGAQWKQACEVYADETKALKRRNTALAAAVAALRGALWASVNGWLLTGGLLLAVFAYGGWQWASAEPVPDRQPVTNASDSNQAAIDAGLRDVLSGMKWAVGETQPRIKRVNGVEYWVVVRGFKDTKTHANENGEPIERHCLDLFASEAVADAGAFLLPNPYRFGLWIKWPHRAAECRLPGKANYQ